MQHYKDINNDSGVSGYTTEANSIQVLFKDGSKYTYTYGSAGAYHIEIMKQLAENGDGLNSYIMRNVRMKYASKH